ncbi:CbtB domain-containing protein [Devosia sp.]|uniref:CbtB domain-containing protein n=1 Tax=Devosia sp. TaxID=1871048 RepID=UPI003BA90C26
MNTSITTSTHSEAQPSIASLSLSQRLVAGLLALLLGVVLIGGVGFASDMRIHNGAHDTRHSLGFPCH